MNDGVLWCNRHKCPYICIDGERYACLFEYVDNLIGNCRVTSLEETPLTLKFDSGCNIPLLSPECGSDSNMKPPPGIIGKFLVAISYNKAKKGSYETLGLHFSDKLDKNPIKGLDLILHLNSARYINK